VISLPLSSVEAMESPLLTLLEVSLYHTWGEQGQFVFHFTENSCLVQGMLKVEKNHVLVLLSCCHWKEGEKSMILSSDFF